MFLRKSFIFVFVTCSVIGNISILPAGAITNQNSDLIKINSNSDAQSFQTLLLASATQGSKPSQAFSSTNKNLRQEIQDNIIDKIEKIDEVRRTADSIKVSTNFHLDAKLIKDAKKGEYYKVDIQYRVPKQGSTVAVVFVYPSATKVADLKKALTNSLKDGYIWEVK